MAESGQEKKVGVQKFKLLYLIKILTEQSDEEHPLSAVYIIDRLAEYGIKAERKSIYADMKALGDFGYDIIKAHSPSQGWFLASRQFEFPEAMLLIDAVTSAPFITPKKSGELIRKLEQQFSVHQWDKIKDQVYIDSNIKQENEDILYNIDELQRAISERKRVSLRYFKRSVDANGKIRLNSRSFLELSPYALIWESDHYYLVCNNPKYDNLMHLRVDRIKSVEQLDMPVRPLREVSRYNYVFDKADYSKKVFNMFGGELQTVIIRCPVKFIDEMVEKFGKDIVVYNCDENNFTFRTTAMISDGFIGWILQFEGLEIIGPAGLREKLVQRTEKLCSLYLEPDRDR